MLTRQLKLDLEFEHGPHPVLLVARTGVLERDLLQGRNYWTWSVPIKWLEATPVFLFTLREDDDDHDGNGVKGSVCFARGVLFPGTGDHSILVNSKGHSVGQLYETSADASPDSKPKLLHLDFPSHSFESHPLDMDEVFSEDPMRSAAMRTRIDQFGLRVPTWVFYCGLDYAEETKVQKAVFERIAKHARQWLGQQREPEVLGQVIGFLPWSASYLYDKSRVSETQWELADDFSHLLCQPDPVWKAGDCEDFSSTMMRLFWALTTTCPEVAPLCLQYCPLALDTVICVNGQECLHNMVVLVPIQLLVDYWLPPREADLLGGRFPRRQKGLPVLVLESTDWSLTNWQDDTMAALKLEQKSNPRVRYPFAPGAYRQQGYFNSFVVAYSYLLRETTGFTAFVILGPHGHYQLGCTVDELTDPEQQKLLHLIPRNVGRGDSEEFLARHFLSFGLPPSLPLTATEKNPNEKRMLIVEQESKSVVPMYVRQGYCSDEHRARQMIARTWPMVTIVGVESIRVCNQFDGLYCVWIQR